MLIALLQTGQWKRNYSQHYKEMLGEESIIPTPRNQTSTLRETCYLLMSPSTLISTWKLDNDNFSLSTFVETSSSQCETSIDNAFSILESNLQRDKQQLLESNHVDKNSSINIQENANDVQIDVNFNANNGDLDVSHYLKIMMLTQRTQLIVQTLTKISKTIIMFPLFSRMRW